MKYDALWCENLRTAQLSIYKHMSSAVWRGEHPGISSRCSLTSRQVCNQCVYAQLHRVVRMRGSTRGCVNAGPGPAKGMGVAWQILLGQVLPQSAWSGSAGVHSQDSWYLTNCVGLGGRPLLA